MHPLFSARLANYQFAVERGRPTERSPLDYRVLDFLNTVANFSERGFGPEGAPLLLWDGHLDQCNKMRGDCKTHLPRYLQL
jgi:hypothetical protein